MSDPVRAALQAVIDTHGDGWTVSDYVVTMGLERLEAGELETTPWWYAPPTQAEWVTDGLIMALEDMRAEVEAD